MLYYSLILLPTIVHAGVDFSWTWSDEISKWADLFAQSHSSHFDEIRCHTCSTVNSSEITGGSGIHPGVFLTSLLLSSIPVTPNCVDPFSIDEAPICEAGFCVKINYTARHSGRMDVLRACIPRSRGVFKQGCTRFASGQAAGTWCVCGEDLCNSAARVGFASLMLLLIAFSIFKGNF